MNEPLPCKLSKLGASSYEKSYSAVPCGNAVRQNIPAQDVRDVMAILDANSLAMVARCFSSNNFHAR